MKTYIGLYYPFIHFKDDNWLKLTALYWDKMGGLVAADYKTKHDSDTVRKLAESELVVNFTPTEVGRVQVGDRFRRLVTDYGEMLRKKYDVHKKDK